MLVASRTLSLNCARLNHMVPVVQKTYPSSDRFSDPQSLSLFPFFFTPLECVQICTLCREGAPHGDTDFSAPQFSHRLQYVVVKEFKFYCLRQCTSRRG